MLLCFAQNSVRLIGTSNCFCHSICLCGPTPMFRNLQAYCIIECDDVNIECFCLSIGFRLSCVCLEVSSIVVDMRGSFVCTWKRSCDSNLSSVPSSENLNCFRCIPANSKAVAPEIRMLWIPAFVLLHIQLRLLSLSMPHHLVLILPILLHTCLWVLRIEALLQESQTRESTPTILECILPGKIRLLQLHAASVYSLDLSDLTYYLLWITPLRLRQDRFKNITYPSCRKLHPAWVQ